MIKHHSTYLNGHAADMTFAGVGQRRKFNEGDIVRLLPEAKRVRKGYGAKEGATARVVRNASTGMVCVEWLDDNRERQSNGEYSEGDFELAPTKQVRFLTAYKEGPDFALTGDNAFNTQRDADNHANELAATHADVTVVVLKVMSSHSSRIVVTSEHA